MLVADAAKVPLPSLHLPHALSPTRFAVLETEEAGLEGWKEEV